MNRKLLIQVSIIFLILLIISISYFAFFYENKGLIINDKNLSKDIENKIVDLKYSAVDDENNTYVITSDFGKISVDDENVLNLTNVKATINLKNSDIIDIYSDFAEYNKVTLDTFFYQNVKLLHSQHSMESDKIFLNYTDKNMKIENNVTYKGLNNQLIADIIDIDLVTKVSKIYMKEEENNVKVKILSNGNN